MLLPKLVFCLPVRLKKHTNLYHEDSRLHLPCTTFLSLARGFFCVGHCYTKEWDENGNFISLRDLALLGQDHSIISFKQVSG